MSTADSTADSAYAASRRLGSTPTSRKKPASCRRWCACRPTRRPATTRRTRRRTARAARGLRLHGRPLCRCRKPIVQEHGLASITNLVVRRRYAAEAGNGLTIALNAHGDVVPPGDGWDARPLRRRRGRRQALRPRLGGQQERLRDLHLRRARPRGARARRWLAAVELHFTYDEEFGGELGPGWLLKHGPDVKPDLLHRRRLLLPGGDGAQRLPAAGGDGARQDGPRGHPPAPASTPCRRAVSILQGALRRRTRAYQAPSRSQVAGITHPYRQRRPHRGRHEHQRRAGQGRAPARSPHDSRGRPECRSRPAIRRAHRRGGGGQSPGITIETRRLLLARALRPLPGNGRAGRRRCSRHGAGGVRRGRSPNQRHAALHRRAPLRRGRHPGGDLRRRAADGARVERQAGRRASWRSRRTSAGRRKVVARTLFDLLAPHGRLRLGPSPLPPWRCAQKLHWAGATPCRSILHPRSLPCRSR